MSTVIASMGQCIWYLKHCELLGGLQDEQLAALERRSRFKQFPAGSPVYLPAQTADSVMLVAEGLVKICHLTAEGKSSTLAFVGAGEVFGELALFGANRREEYVESLRPTTLVRIPRDALEQLVRDDMTVAFRLNRMLGLRRLKIERRLRNLLFTSNEHRLIHLLIDLAEDFGEHDGNRVRLKLKLSHQEMANLIGITRESVTILVGRLKADRMLDGQRQSVVINDLDALRQVVGRFP